MAEHPPVLLRKLSGGGCTIWHDGEAYTWPAGDPVAEVPYDLAVALLDIPDGDYRAEGDSGEGGEDEGGAPASQEPPSPITDKPKAGTARRAGTAGKSAGGQGSRAAK